MAERGWDTAFWNDTFVQGLSSESKLLFFYLATNPHCNQAGLYEISLKTITFDTGIDEEKLPDILKSLEPKIAWYPDHNIVWVKNFVKRQTKSPKFLIAVAKCLNSIHIPSLVQEFIQFNLEQHSISIPYPYNTNTISIPSLSSSSAVSLSSSSAKADKEERGSGGEIKQQDINEDMAEIATLYDAEIGKITPFVAENLKDAYEEYGAENLKDAIKAAARQNIRKWSYIQGILKKLAGEKAGKDDSDKYIKGRYGHMVQR